jgi:Zn-dependent protease
MFGHAVKLFTLMGFAIKVDASWLLIAALIVWSLSTGYFPMELPGLAQGTAIVLGVVAMLGLFGSLILHELAHALVARRYGLGIGGITLFLFGGVAELEEEPRSAASEFWIAVAGPAMSVALAGLFGLAGSVTAGVGAVLLAYLATVNLFLALFNLLPAFPLDGGRVLRALIWQRTGDLLEATRKASGAGTILALLLMAFGLYAALTGGGVSGIWVVMIGVFVLTASRASYQRLLLQDSLKGRRVVELMTADPLTATPDMTLAAVGDGIMVAHAVTFVPVVAGEAPIGYVDTELMRAVPRGDWAATRVADVMAPLDPACIVPPRMTAEAALDRLARGPQRKLIVAEGGRIRGILSLRDLMGHIAVVQALGRGTPRAGRG